MTGKWKKKDKSKLKSVEKIKNHSVEAVEKVHVRAFVLFELVVYILMERVLFSRVLVANEWYETLWCEIIRCIAFAGGYYVLFVLVKKYYSWKIIKDRPKFDVEGEWYHVHIPNKLGQNEIKKPLSAGVTTIVRDLNDFTFKSENYKYVVEDGVVKQYSSEPSTTWHTETSEICDSNHYDLVEVYQAHSAERQTVRVEECPVCKQHFARAIDIPEAAEMRYGIHLYRIEPKKQRIVCDYSDCWPSLKSGKLYLYKNKADRDARIKEYFEN